MPVIFATENLQLTDDGRLYAPVYEGGESVDEVRVGHMDRFGDCRFVESLACSLATELEKWLVQEEWMARHGEEIAAREEREAAEARGHFERSERDEWNGVYIEGLKR